MIRRWLAIALIALVASAASAQDGVPTPRAVTMDDVNAVSEQLYCPVCPNEKLDDCQTQACVQWRAEIADSLAQGDTEAEIIDAFVRRYGDRVVAIPQDSGLRALSLVTPFVLAGLAAVAALFTLSRWAGRPKAGSPQPLTKPARPTPADDPYRAQIERDLLP